MQILVIAILIASGTALNLSSDEEQKFYDPEAYKTALEDVQDQVELKIKQIKAQIEQIHSIIDNVQITQTVRLVKLTESMADQRDSLYQMQQILKIPFSIRQCKCAALDEKTRKEINAKIEKIDTSIHKMKDSLRKCTFDKCPRYEQLILELNQQQNYLDIIKETVNSECCDSPYILEEQTASGMIDLSGHLFKDNLKVEGWFYGTISKTDYILSRFELATKYNLTSCPLENPYVNIFQNTCFNCSDHQYFSLGTRKCYGCQADQYFNTSTSRCVDCPDHQFFNHTLGECSHCPVTLVFNDQTKQCVPCPRNSYPEFETSNCIACESYHFYDAQANECVTCDLKKGEFLNLETLQCQICPNASFFSMKEQKCISCPGQSYYSSTNQKCVTCPNSEHFLSNKLECGKCNDDEFYNPHVRICQKCEEGLVFNDVMKACVADQAEVIGHEKCPSDYPYYNKYADKCEKCPLGQYFNFENLSCKTKHYISICPPERPLYKKQVLSCEMCPEKTPQYDPYYHKCISCPASKPKFNQQTLDCEVCEEGTYYSFDSMKCQDLQKPISVAPIKHPESSSNSESAQEYAHPIAVAPVTYVQKSEDSWTDLHHLSQHQSQARVNPIVYSSIQTDQNHRYPYAQPIPQVQPYIQSRPDSIDATPVSTQFVTQPVNEGPHELPNPYSVSPTVQASQQKPQKKYSYKREGLNAKTVAQNQKVQINPSTIPILTLKPFSHSPNTDTECSSLDQYMNYATHQCESKSKKCNRQQKYNNVDHKCVRECFNSEQIYDYKTQSCQRCGQNDFYSMDQHSCKESKAGQVKCKDDEFYSQQKNKCLKDFEKCSQDQFLNTLSGQCERKSDSCTKHQFYNSGIHQCQHRSVLCLQNQKYDEETMLCLDQ